MNKNFSLFCWSLSHPSEEAAVAAPTPTLLQHCLPQHGVPAVSRQHVTKLVVCTETNSNCLWSVLVCLWRSIWHVRLYIHAHTHLFSAWKARSHVEKCAHKYCWGVKHQYLTPRYPPWVPGETDIIIWEVTPRTLFLSVRKDAESHLKAAAAAAAAIHSLLPLQHRLPIVLVHCGLCVSGRALTTTHLNNHPHRPLYPSLLPLITLHTPIYPTMQWFNSIQPPSPSNTIIKHAQNPLSVPCSLTTSQNSIISIFFPYHPSQHLTAHP